LGTDIKAMKEELEKLKLERTDLESSLKEIDETIEFQRHKRKITEKKLKLVDEENRIH
jgi:chromosome segregation ATPase